MPRSIYGSIYCGAAADGDHGSLSGLGDNDHNQYLLTDCSNDPLTGDLSTNDNLKHYFGSSDECAIYYDKSNDRFTFWMDNETSEEMYLTGWLTVGGQQITGKGTGANFYIYANDIDANVGMIKLRADGNLEWHVGVGDKIIYTEVSTGIFSMWRSATDVAEIAGYGGAIDYLKLRADANVTYPFLILGTNADIVAEVGANRNFIIKEAGTVLATVDSTGLTVENDIYQRKDKKHYYDA